MVIVMMSNKGDGECGEEVIVSVLGMGGRERGWMKTIIKSQ